MKVIFTVENQTDHLWKTKVPKTKGFRHFSVLEGIRTLDLPLRSKPECP